MTLLPNANTMKAAALITELEAAILSRAQLFGPAPEFTVSFVYNSFVVKPKNASKFDALLVSYFDGRISNLIAQIQALGVDVSGLVEAADLELTLTAQMLRATTNTPLPALTPQTFIGRFVASNIGADPGFELVGGDTENFQVVNKTLVVGSTAQIPDLQSLIGRVTISAGNVGALSMTRDFCIALIDDRDNWATGTFAVPTAMDLDQVIHSQGFLARSATLHVVDTSQGAVDIVCPASGQFAVVDIGAGVGPSLSNSLTVDGVSVRGVADSKLPGVALYDLYRAPWQISWTPTTVAYLSPAAKPALLRDWGLLTPQQLPNIAPTWISLTNVGFPVMSLPLSAPAGYVIGTLSTIDPNPTGSYAYSIVDDPQGWFALAGADLTVATGAALTASIAHVKIRSTDQGGLSFDRQFSLLVSAQAPGVGQIGPAGAPGGSAYDVAVAGGYLGTQAQWLASLRGLDGAPGAPGASAYAIAVAGGYMGTQAQWLASLSAGNTYTTGPTPHTSPKLGDVWHDNSSSVAKTHIRLPDGLGGSAWVVVSGVGGSTATYTTGSSPHASPKVGDVWLNSLDSTTNIYLPDGGGGFTWVSTQGVAGSNGNTILGGTGAPAFTLGVDGDFYIDTTTAKLYGPKVSGGWPGSPLLLKGGKGDPGIQGLPGAPGRNGNTLLSGSGQPSNVLGANGDFFLDGTAKVLYGPKNTGIWPASGLSLVGQAGQQGRPGQDGADGADGSAGNTVLNGAGTPAAALGADGDFYIDTSTWRLFGPKAAGAWPAFSISLKGAKGDPGLTGGAGAPGRDGNTLLNGTGQPSNTLGANGDYYIDGVAKILYGPKASGAWPATTLSLVGQQGRPGRDGLAGSPGIDGNTVLNGPGTPLNSEGLDGDFYIETTHWQIFGPKTAGMWPAGFRSLVGPTGARGNTILSGSGAPTDFVGVGGDFYVDIDSSRFYGPRGALHWPASYISLARQNRYTTGPAPHASPIAGDGWFDTLAGSYLQYMPDGGTGFVWIGT